MVEGKEAEPKADQFRKAWAAARKNLREAIDKVEEQLIGLADALLKSNDPNMIGVAVDGLTQLIGGLRASASARVDLTRRLGVRALAGTVVERTHAQVERRACWRRASRRSSAAVSP